MFKLQSPYQPSGDQPNAIASLVKGLSAGYKHQTLKGATGTGKTFVMANIIQNVQKPTLIIAHNKPWLPSFMVSFLAFFQTIQFIILLAISITTSLRPTLPPAILTLKKIVRLTKKLIGLGTRRHLVC